MTPINHPTDGFLYGNPQVHFQPLGHSLLSTSKLYLVLVEFDSFLGFGGFLALVEL